MTLVTDSVEDQKLFVAWSTELFSTVDSNWRGTHPLTLSLPESDCVCLAGGSIRWKHRADLAADSDSDGGVVS